MKAIIHKSEDRGYADHGWLKAKHSFSFASWYNPSKVHFGALRVLNDDQVAPHMGFSEHPHDNMEIITIPLEGAVRHKDSLGSEGKITAGEVQVMSAGSGVFHSEFNKEDEILRLFQIWIFPRERNVTPRYQQVKLPQSEGEIVQIVGPERSEDKAWIHQDAWLSWANLNDGDSVNYQLHKPENGVYIMNVNGDTEVENNILESRDAIGITETNEVNITKKNKGSVLIIEVPMEF